MLYIEYCDNIGVISEFVDEYGIRFAFGLAYFNDKKIPVQNIMSIMQEEG